MIITPVQKHFHPISFGQLNSKDSFKNAVNSKIDQCKTAPVELLQAYSGLKTPSFSGKLDPQIHEKARIQRNLKGEFWGNVYALDYMSSHNITNAIYNFIDSVSEIPEPVLQEINKQKAQSFNFTSLLITHEPIKKSEEFEIETKSCFKDLKDQMFELNKTFEQVGLKPDEVKIFNKFVANTFITLYLMGFPDAISHAGQVARKNVVEAYKLKASTEDILKSAMVGWLHDPKLKANVSWSNLATHPVVGGAIALTVLDSFEFEKLLTDYLPDNKAVAIFKEGIIESLFVNNDSAFVLENVVLNKPKFPVPNPESGVADSHPELSGIAIRRLKAPSEGKKPDRITSDMLEKMKGITFDTGIKALNMLAFKNICNSLSSKYPILKAKAPDKILLDILNGNISDVELINDFNKAIKDRTGSTKSLKISASNLFCHHDEVTPSGKIPSFALVISDPLLLSPHKVLLGGVQNTPLGRIKSYFQSFNDNVKSVPFKVKENALIWQVDLYRSMLCAADELSSQNNFEAFNEQFGVESFEIQSQKLVDLLSLSSTWGEYADFEIGGQNRDKLTHMSSIIANHYKQAAEKSPGMFNLDL